MSETISQALTDRLDRFDQQHVLRWWEELNATERATLTRQLDAIDFELIWQLFDQGRASAETPEGNSPPDRAKRAVPPSRLVRLPETPEEHEGCDAATERGQQILDAGQVGAILVAGGQGVRLGFPHPKGMYPIGPVSSCTLFQILAEQVLARSRQSGVSIPYYIMTSEATHAETIPYFEKHDFFGLNTDDVKFFQQGNMPAVDDATGRLLLAEKSRISASPDGHGGMLFALAKAGLLDDMRRRGIEYLFYHQVDNPTAKICDPTFLGFHAMLDSEMSTKVVAKKSAAEKMGVVVEVDGQTQIIEYSDLPVELARQTDDQGRLVLWAGNTAIHVVSLRFLERLIDERLDLPFHLAHKAVTHLNDNGKLIEPDRPNALKFERFIFDALPHAENALVFEADRWREFNPVKNKKENDHTPDTPESAQAALINIARAWLREAGVVVADHVPVEISPLFALDARDVRDKLQPDTEYSSPFYLK